MRLDNEFIASLCPSFSLKLDNFNFQLLWLIPIIEVIWADDCFTDEERKILFYHVNRFVSLIKYEVPEITNLRVRRFLEPLLDPSVASNKNKKSDLTRLSKFITTEILGGSVYDKKIHLYDICEAIASATGITIEEEQVLKDLFQELQLYRRM